MFILWNLIQFAASLALILNVEAISLIVIKLSFWSVLILSTIYFVGPLFRRWECASILIYSQSSLKTYVRPVPSAICHSSLFSFIYTWQKNNTAHWLHQEVPPTSKLRSSYNFNTPRITFFQTDSSRTAWKSCLF